MKTIKELVDNDLASTSTQLTEELTYDKIIEKLVEARDNNVPIDEGLFGSIFGGIVGATAGPAIMKAVCKALGIDERGALGTLMTSKLILSSMGITLGWKM